MSAFFFVLLCALSVLVEGAQPPKFHSVAKPVTNAAPQKKPPEPRFNARPAPAIRLSKPKIDEKEDSHDYGGNSAFFEGNHTRRSIPLRREHLRSNKTAAHQAHSSHRDFKDIIHDRLALLESISLTDMPKANASCNMDRYVVYTGNKQGQMGNNLIELTHGLYFATELKATLVLPPWMKSVLAPFDLSFLHEGYCFVHHNHFPGGKPPRDKTVLSMDVGLAFSGYPVLKKGGGLQPLSDKVVADASVHFIRIYSALWSGIREDIRNAGEYIIENFLGGSLSYTSVHKRNFGGDCYQQMKISTQLSDYSPAEMPMEHKEWKNLTLAHPLCTMSADFVETTASLNNKSTRLFVAFDGNGDISDYVKKKAVFGTDLDTANRNASSKENKKLFPDAPRPVVDLFVAAMGEFFILNPRSTFSWQVFLLRDCFGLPSAPILKNNDLFLMEPEALKQEGRNHLWVNWMSIKAARGLFPLSL